MTVTTEQDLGAAGVMCDWSTQYMLGILPKQLESALGHLGTDRRSEVLSDCLSRGLAPTSPALDVDRKSRSTHASAYWHGRSGPRAYRSPGHWEPTWKPELLS
jgi:hypothetical protein